jgi:hypothetical protein
LVVHCYGLLVAYNRSERTVAVISARIDEQLLLEPSLLVSICLHGNPRATAYTYSTVARSTVVVNLDDFRFLFFHFAKHLP